MIKKILAGLLICLVTFPSFAEDMLSAKSFLSNTLWDMNGRQVSLEYFKGRPMIINFWASWCGGCREEVRELNALKMEGDGKVDVLGISIDEDLSLAKDFLRSTSMSYLSLVSGSLGGPLMKSMGNTQKGVPFTVFIDKNGIVTYSKLGLLKRSDFDFLRSRLSVR